ncbi:MAG: 6-phosphogluconolactonase [Leptolyngbyaceae cyanobacterium SL_1_1]|nr:6-phosphogluconolactonase [Leptolyngbyaceae cyanobacterium RM1_1_2]NJO09670.1 6-phosphogluconolactonase [Leptolyngbyaceae cyanobacterium SL_1_1]
MKPTIEVLTDKAELIERSQTVIVEKIRGAIAQQGRCTIALAGGSTPKPIYGAIAQKDLPWDKLFIFWGDERYVARDHPDSNQGMARSVWLDQVPIPAENVFPVPTMAPEPAAAAASYEQTLRDFFQVSGAAVPRLDIVLLGLGEDAHTASLFPHTEALQVRDRLVTVGNKLGEARLTVTVPLINQAHSVIFIVSGANKQEALAHVFSAESDDMAYPARLIQPRGEVWWLLDAAAGANLGLSAG